MTPIGGLRIPPPVIGKLITDQKTFPGNSFTQTYKNYGKIAVFRGRFFSVKTKFFFFFAETRKRYSNMYICPVYPYVVHPGSDRKKRRKIARTWRAKCHTLSLKCDGILKTLEPHACIIMYILPIYIYVYENNYTVFHVTFWAARFSTHLSCGRIYVTEKKKPDNAKHAFLIHSKGFLLIDRVFRNVAATSSKGFRSKRFSKGPGFNDSFVDRTTFAHNDYGAPRCSEPHQRKRERPNIRVGTRERPKCMRTVIRRIIRL